MNGGRGSDEMSGINPTHHITHAVRMFSSRVGGKMNGAKYRHSLEQIPVPLSA